MAVTSPSNGLHIDYTYSISLGFNKERYFLIMLEFLNMTGIKIGTIRFDGAKEFGKSVSFQNFCNDRGVIMEPVAEYTHVQNVKSENAIHISKEHVRCLLRASYLPRTFWPYTLRHFLRLRAYWPTDNGNRCAWERLDAAYPNNKLRYTLSKDLHVFGSYVTGHLPRAHPVIFKHKKVMKMSDPKHFDPILPFLQPTDVPHKIDQGSTVLIRGRLQRNLWTWE